MRPASRAFHIDSKLYLQVVSVLREDEIALANVPHGVIESSEKYLTLCSTTRKLFAALSLTSRVPPAPREGCRAHDTRDTVCERPSDNHTAETLEPISTAAKCYDADTRTLSIATLSTLNSVLGLGSIDVFSIERSSGVSLKGADRWPRQQHSQNVSFTPTGEARPQQLLYVRAPLLVGPDKLIATW